jgi:hypothetical protein
MSPKNRCAEAARIIPHIRKLYPSSTKARRLSPPTKRLTPSAEAVQSRWSRPGHGGGLQGCPRVQRPLTQALKDGPFLLLQHQSEQLI